MSTGCKVTVFPSVINKSFVGRYSKAMKVSCFSSNFHPLVLASFDDFLLHQSFYIYHLAFYSKEELSLLPQLLINLHQYGIKDACSIQGVIIHYYYYSFWCSNCPTFGQRDSFIWFLCPHYSLSTPYCLPDQMFSPPHVLSLSQTRRKELFLWGHFWNRFNLVFLERCGRPPKDTCQTCSHCHVARLACVSLSSPLGVVMIL